MNTFFVRGRGKASGFTLIELMISLLLGLLVIAAAGALFISNKRVYGATETVNRLQEGSRAAFEIMARDIRSAGASPCGAPITSFQSVLNTPNDFHWSEFSQAVHGATNTYGDVLRLYNGADFDNPIYITKHDGPQAPMGLSSNGDLDPNGGEILVACNSARGFIFQSTGLNANGLIHNTGKGTPGNCGKNFGPNCSNGANDPQAYCFSFGRTCNRGMPSEPPPPAQLIKVNGVEWWIDLNGRGTTSLFRQQLAMGGAATTRQEIVEGVTGMTLSYQQTPGGAFLAAANVTDWSQVRAINVQLTFAAVEGIQRGQDLRGTDNAVLDRTMSSIITIRNREGVL